MATATKDDIKNLYTLYHVLENFEKGAQSIEDFEYFDEKEKPRIARIFVDDEIDTEQLIHYLAGLTHGFHRVVMGYEVLFDNCADKCLSYLDFNKEIKESTEVWNYLEKQLKESGQVTITLDSPIGKMIMAEKPSEEVNNA